MKSLGGLMTYSRANPLPQGIGLPAKMCSVERRAAHWNTALRKEQALQFSTRAFGAHERFADQERIHVADFHQLDIGAVKNATLGDHQTITRNTRQQVEGG